MEKNLLWGDSIGILKNRKPLYLSIFGIVGLVSLYLLGGRGVLPDEEAAPSVQISESKRSLKKRKSAPFAKLSDAEVREYFLAADQGGLRGVQNSYQFLNAEAFRQMGSEFEIEREAGRRFGESSFDLVISTESNLFYNAGLIARMTYALKGWMEVDPDAAINAAEELFSNPRYSISWKDQIAMSHG